MQGMSWKRKIAVAVTHRAPYGRLKPVLSAIQEHPDLDLQIIVAGPAVRENMRAAFRSADLSRVRTAMVSYIRMIVGGDEALSSLNVTSRLLSADGFSVAAHVPLFIEGGNLRAMTQSVGVGLMALPDTLETLKPDILLVHADRFEMLSFAVAGALMNIPIAHTQGGDVSGTIDETVRHAITKLATFHFPTTEKSRQRILSMGEDPKHVWCVGCPTIDALKKIDLSDSGGIYGRNHQGWGDKINFAKPFVLVMHHPVTTEYGKNEETMRELLAAIESLHMPTILFSPNIDAGTDKATALLRAYINGHTLPALNVQKNFTSEDFYRVLNAASVAIGNSSSFIREGSYLGTPAVLAGSRQHGREHGENIIIVETKSDAIVQAARKQIIHGRYDQNRMYGDGSAAEQIADILAKLPLPPLPKAFLENSVLSQRVVDTFEE